MFLRYDGYLNYCQYCSGMAAKYEFGRSQAAIAYAYFL